MQILFLTMSNFSSVDEHGIYTDLIRELASRGNELTVLTPIEKRNGIKTSVHEYGSIHVVKVRTGNLFNVGLIEKAFSRAMICSNYRRALKMCCKGKKYDLVLFSTPPTTLAPIVKKEKRNGAYAFLLLKDIFPQNAVDLGLIKYKGIAYHFFRRAERKTYSVADTIGCMSPANVDFLLKQDPWINPQKVCVCPNSIEVREMENKDERQAVLLKYGIPTDKLLFVYGGGLGKPQGIDFLLECVRASSNMSEFFFVVIGSGPFFSSIKELEYELPQSLKVINWLHTDEYEKIVKNCDVGVVFLNHSFKIPNFPSRILMYMESHLPILASTDPNTDVGRIAETNGFGFWCESNDVNGFINLMIRFKDSRLRKEMGENSFVYLRDHYSVKIVADDILAQLNIQKDE